MLDFDMLYTHMYISRSNLSSKALEPKQEFRVPIPVQPVKAWDISIKGSKRSNQIKKKRDLNAKSTNICSK